jgi:hypothetical protein
MPETLAAHCLRKSAEKIDSLMLVEPAFRVRMLMVCL